MRRRIQTCIIIAFTSLILSGCGNLEVRRALSDVEAILDERPAEALETIEKIDSTSLRFKPLRMRRDLLYAIALDKNDVDDGGFASEAREVEEWYERFGDKSDKLRAMYYYGDQLRDAGRLEEATVQLMRSEKEAVKQENWFLAGMSARSLYLIYARTYNGSEQLSWVERALDYFRKAGKEAHEDDARIKLAVAFYDNSRIEKADSVFNLAIKIATEKRDTVRLRKALSESTDVFLVKGNYQPDSVIARLSRAELLGYIPNSRTTANYALAFTLRGEKEKGDSCLQAAYRLSEYRSQKAYVSSRECDILEISKEYSKALDLFKDLDRYTNSLTRRILDQSVVEAYNSYLELDNDRLSHDAKVKRSLFILSSLLALAVIVIALFCYKRLSERHRTKTEKLLMEADRYRLALKELESFGFEAFDKIGRAYYSAENSPESVVKAYGSIIGKLRDKSYQDGFIENIDKTHDGVISLLTSELPSLSDSRMRFFAYLVQGLSYTTISVIMDCNQRQNLYDLRKRLVRTIKKSSPAHEKLFLSYLESRDSVG